MAKEVCSFCNDNKFIWNVLCGIEGCAKEDAIPKNCNNCDWGKYNKCGCSNNEKLDESK